MNDLDYFNYIDYMRMANMPAQYVPMMEMPQEQLESMYPRIYFIIFPEVCRSCDVLIYKFGPMYTPTKKQMDEMVESIEQKVAAEVDKEYEDEDEKCKARPYDQFGDGHHNYQHRDRRRSDLIRILLLREILRRRRRPPHHGGYPYNPGWGY